MMRTPFDEVYRFVKEALVGGGVVEAVAELTAKGLCSTSLRGVDSHGIRLLPHYVAAIEGGRINPQPAFRFEKTAASTGILDADHGLGHAAGIVAMRHAINLARDSGAGFVSVKNSSHCGAMAYYVLEACEEDMIGYAYTHASPKVRTPNSPRPFFGANPICFAAPMLTEGPFCFDSSVTYISVHKLKQYREEGRPLPPGYAADREGRETIYADKAEQLLPIGGYKGFGLAMMVDILCGLLAAMPVGRGVSQMYGSPLSEKRYLGQFYGALRIDVFEDVSRFKQRLQELAEGVRSESRADPSIPIQVPGDPEKAHERDRRENGIPITALEMKWFQELADRLGIEPLGGAIVQPQGSSEVSIIESEE